MNEHTTNVNSIPARAAARRHRRWTQRIAAMFAVLLVLGGIALGVTLTVASPIATADAQTIDVQPEAEILDAVMVIRGDERGMIVRR